MSFIAAVGNGNLLGGTQRKGQFGGNGGSRWVIAPLRVNEGMVNAGDRVIVHVPMNAVRNTSVKLAAARTVWMHCS